VAAEAADAALDGEIWRDTAGYCDNVASHGDIWRDIARHGDLWRDMARYGRMGGVAVSTSRVQSDNTSRVADYPPMYSARRQSDATRHLASGRPTQDVEVLCRIWWTPSAQRAPAPQEARKRCKALAARTMCSVGDHEPPRSEHLRGRTRPAETRQQESRVAASVSTDCSIQTTSASPTIKSGMKPGWIFVAGGPAGTSGECLKPLARPRRAGGALATWPAAWPAAPPAAMAARNICYDIVSYSL
jgi:hypothetical protein